MQIDNKQITNNTSANDSSNLPWRGNISSSILSLIDMMIRVQLFSKSNVLFENRMPMWRIKKSTMKR